MYDACSSRDTYTRPSEFAKVRENMLLTNIPQTTASLYIKRYQYLRSDLHRLNLQRMCYTAVIKRNDRTISSNPSIRLEFGRHETFAW